MVNWVVIPILGHPVFDYFFTVTLSFGLMALGFQLLFRIVERS